MIVHKKFSGRSKIAVKRSGPRIPLAHPVPDAQPAEGENASFHARQEERQSGAEQEEKNKRAAHNSTPKFRPGAGKITEH
jgi:hypothetical protein